MKFITWAQVTAFVSSLALLPATALAAFGDNIGVGNIHGIASGSDLGGTVGNIINIGLGLAGLVAVIYLIYGGIRYITSRGDETEAEEAKNVILYAIIGLIVIGLAAVIARYVIVIVVGGAAGVQ